MYTRIFNTLSRAAVEAKEALMREERFSTSRICGMGSKLKVLEED